MLKALFLDMDDTLCDTQGANDKARVQLAQLLEQQYAAKNSEVIAAEYVRCVYRQWSPEEQARYLPIIEQLSEEAFRVQLIEDLASQYAEKKLIKAQALELQLAFDRFRIEFFDFFPGIQDFLIEARKYFTLVVITNGPEFSQIPKVEAVNLAQYVDHIVIGGQEPEQKPAVSIFQKALKLAGCQAHEAIHVGDSLATDIQGAHNSGITSVWIQHQQPLDSELGLNPSHTLVHPSEIPKLIREFHPV